MKKYNQTVINKKEQTGRCQSRGWGGENGSLGGINFQFYNKLVTDIKCTDWGK